MESQVARNLDALAALLDLDFREAGFIQKPRKISDRARVNIGFGRRSLLIVASQKRLFSLRAGLQLVCNGLHRKRIALNAEPANHARCRERYIGMMTKAFARERV